MSEVVVRIESDKPGEIDLGLWVGWKWRSAECPFCNEDGFLQSESGAVDRRCEHFVEEEEGYAVFRKEKE